MQKKKLKNKPDTLILTTEPYPWNQTLSEYPETHVERIKYEHIIDRKKNKKTIG